jgi:hypothetical protein
MSDSQTTLIGYLTDPHPVPVQWDIQTCFRYLVFDGATADELRDYIRSLLDCGQRPSPEDNPAEVVALRRLARDIRSVEGVDWKIVAASVR